MFDPSTPDPAAPEVPAPVLYRYLCVGHDTLTFSTVLCADSKPEEGEFHVLTAVPGEEYVVADLIHNPYLVPADDDTKAAHAAYEAELANPTPPPATVAEDPPPVDPLIGSNGHALAGAPLVIGDENSPEAVVPITSSGPPSDDPVQDLADLTDDLTDLEG